MDADSIMDALAILFWDAYSMVDATSIRHVEVDSIANTTDGCNWNTFGGANVACRIVAGAICCNIGKENGENRGFHGQSCMKSMEGDF